MVSELLLSRIDRFITEEVREPYRRVEKVSFERKEQIMRGYIPAIVQLPEETRGNILSRLEESWRDNPTHGHRRRWGRAIVGVAEYLLKPNYSKEVNEDYAVDVIVRISRWYYTNNNLWKRFQPHAQYIAEQFWGDIENLYEHSCRSA